MEANVKDDSGPHDVFAVGFVGGPYLQGFAQHTGVAVWGSKEAAQRYSMAEAVRIAGSITVFGQRPLATAVLPL